MRYSAFTLILALAFLTLNGCKEPMPTAKSVDQTFTGLWQMDHQATKTAQLETLEKAGRLQRSVNNLRRCLTVPILISSCIPISTSDAQWET